MLLLQSLFPFLSVISLRPRGQSCPDNEFCMYTACCDVGEVLVLDGNFGITALFFVPTYLRYNTLGM